MGFWHTGYEEFHEPAGLEDYIFQPSPPQRYVCDICSKCLDDLESLRRHRFESHPQRQPLLFIRGRAVGQIALKIMTLLDPDEVIVEDVSVCIVNGKSVAAENLGHQLSQVHSEFVNIELTNAGVTTKCTLDFQIANEHDLKGIEEAFIRMARDKNLSINSIARFIKDCEIYKSAILYCDGICQYLYGVMARERIHDSGLGAEQYSQKYLQAVDILSGFDRRLSRCIRALVSFHFNHFEDAVFLAPTLDLRHVANSFAGLLKGKPWYFQDDISYETGNTVENLLMDQETLQIITYASLREVDLKDKADDLRLHFLRDNSGYDRLKKGLLGSEALALCKTKAAATNAEKIAREWIGSVDTTYWAETMLKRLGKI